MKIISVVHFAILQGFVAQFDYFAGEYYIIQSWLPYYHAKIRIYDFFNKSRLNCPVHGDHCVVSNLDSQSSQLLLKNCDRQTLTRNNSKCGRVFVILFDYFLSERLLGFNLSAFFDRKCSIIVKASSVSKSQLLRPNVAHNIIIKHSVEIKCLIKWR